MMLPLFADIFNHVVCCDVGWLSACAFAIVSSVFYAYTSVCVGLIHLSSVIILNAKTNNFFLIDWYKKECKLCGELFMYPCACYIPVYDEI